MTNAKCRMLNRPDSAFGIWHLALTHARQCAYPTTSMPIDRAVPATVLNADSSDSQFRSGIFRFAMSSTCFLVTGPTWFLFGSFDPFARFAARFNRIEAGGVFVMKVYDRSA